MEGDSRRRKGGDMSKKALPAEVVTELIRCRINREKQLMISGENNGIRQEDIFETIATEVLFTLS